MGSNAVLLTAALIMAALAVTALVIVFRWRPVLGIVAWAVAMFSTPVWLGVQAGVFVTALIAVTAVAVLSGPAGRLRPSAVDAVVAVFAIVLILLAVTRSAEWGPVQEVLLMWVLPYAWGRVILSRGSAQDVSGIIAAMAGIAAVLAIVEFVTGVNVFHLTPGASSSVWGTEQIRAGLPRAEGAFGHSIALGGVLAMSVPFVLSATWRPWLRVGTFVAVAAAVALSFSRLGLVTLVVATVLSLVLMRHRIAPAVRWSVAGVLALGAVLALPLLLQIFGEAGAEAEGSAEYRADLLPLLDSAALFGTSPAQEVLATGQIYFGGFRSIDNALLLVALRFGLIPLALLIALLAVAVVAAVRGRADAGLIALLSQVPAFGTVALITQYAAFVWFAAGLAVASYTLVEERSGSKRAQLGQAVPSA